MCRVALLAAAGAIGTSSRADAALYYWQDSEPGYYRPERAIEPRRSRTRHPAKKEAAEKNTGTKPQGPLIIVVSINKQQVRIYDANGFFAEAPVSTGMRGHPTPTGVFSVIQKQKWHRSNIYSGAPMPYMQRITWSGIAMHAGVLPGYPASHGCIRMPPAFAIKMYNWTRMGARVLVTPGEIVPQSFTHPLLPALKVQPQPAAAATPQSNAPAAVKADKGAPDQSQATLALRPTVGHADPVASAQQDAAAGPPPLGNTRTADASGDAAAANASVTASDAASANRNDVQTKDPANANAQAVKMDEPKPDVVEPVMVKPDVVKPDTTKADAKPGAASIDAPTDVNKDQARQPNAKAADAKAADVKAAAAKAEAAKRAGPISVFVSRKDSKLYVRQNFAPLFDASVTIAPSDRPLGTHVFTAEIDNNDPNVLHWSVVSLPASMRRPTHHEEVERAVKHRRGERAAAIEPKPLPEPDSPAEALDRITIPADVMARITEALTTGASIVVADQGINQGETGEGTDFIVSLR